MDPNPFDYCVIKCKKCYLELENFDIFKNHVSICKNIPIESGELIAERAKVFVLAKMLEASTGLKLDKVFGKVEEIKVDQLSVKIIEPEHKIENNQSESQPGPSRKKGVRSNILKKKVLPMSDVSEDEKIERELSKINAKRTQFFEDSHEEIMRRIRQINNWEEVKIERTKLIKYLSGRDWEMLVKDHWEMCKKDERFNRGNIPQYFTSIEMRLIDDFRNILPIQAQDVDLYKLGISLKDSKNDIFELESFMENFINLQLILVPVENILKDYFQKTPKCFGYLPVRAVDSYTFFLLKKNIQKPDTLEWKYDCRLESTGEQLYNEILRYLVYHFRKIYLGIFGDNDYHSEIFTTITKNVENEMRQIISNLIWCESSAKFIKVLGDLVKKHCTINGDNQKFPLHADDKDQGKRLKNDLKNSSTKKIFNDLFDTVRDDQIEEFMKKIN